MRNGLVVTLFLGLMAGAGTSRGETAAEPPEWFDPHADFHINNWFIRSGLYWNLPAVASRFFDQDRSQTRYAVNNRVNPFYISPDLDGDGKTEVIVFIRNLENDKDGFLVCGLKKSCEILLAGNTMTIKWREGTEQVYTREADDSGFMQMWTVTSRKIHHPDIGSAWYPENKGDFVFVSKPETDGWILYWDGKQMLIR